MKVFSLPVKMPNWAQWCAVDAFGVLVAFENKPSLSEFNDGYWHARGRRKDIVQYDSQSFAGYKTSLVKLP